MNRRVFLPSVIALPLVAVGMPRLSPVDRSGQALLALKRGLSGGARVVIDTETGISIRFIRSWEEAKEPTQFDILLEHVIALGPVVDV